MRWANSTMEDRQRSGYYIMKVFPDGASRLLSVDAVFGGLPVMRFTELSRAQAMVLAGECVYYYSPIDDESYTFQLNGFAWEKKREGPLKRGQRNT